MRHFKIIFCIFLFHFVVSYAISQPFTDPCVKVSYAKALEASELKIYSKAEKWFKVAKDCPLATTEKKKQLNVRIKECKKLIQKSQESMVERNTLLSEVIPEFEMGYIEGKIFQMGKESTVL